MLALAYWAEARIEDGTYESYADLAHVLAITRARMTQIAQLRCLSPRIQAAILHGERRISERVIRSIAGTPEWSRQDARVFTLAPTRDY